MKWTTKWGILWSLAHLPGGRGLHEWMLRRHGELAALEKSSRFQNAMELVSTVQQHIGHLEGKTVVEIGTGWVPAVPLAFALCGARVQTFDVRRLSDAKLFRRTLAELGRKANQLAQVANVSELEIQQRLETVADSVTLENALSKLGGGYTAPADTCHLPMADNAADVLISSLVLQCIPAHLLRGVLRESWRVLSPQGVAVHRLRLTDEYAAGDPQRNHFEYLQYSQTTWDRWYNHRLKHQNRLRASQFSTLFENVGFECLERSAAVDSDSIPILKKTGVDSSFAQLDWADLATVCMSVVLRKWSPQAARVDDVVPTNGQRTATLLAETR